MAGISQTALVNFMRRKLDADPRIAGAQPAQLEGAAQRFLVRDVPATEFAQHIMDYPQVLGYCPQPRMRVYRPERHFNRGNQGEYQHGHQRKGPHRSSTHPQHA
jgi:hypothetical protein